MSSPMRFILLLVLAASLSNLAAAQTQACRVEPFQGATLPQGATAHMAVASGSRSCSITNFGVSSERRNLAESGSITLKPQHGTAEFAAPKATYKPESGYIGEDEFSYEAFAKGNIDQQVHLRVHVKVTVVAP